MECPAWLTELRFNYEAYLFHDLMRHPEVQRRQDQSQRRHYFNLRKRQLLGTAVQISPDLFPTLHAVYSDCLQRLGGGLSGELYVYQASEYNANVYAHDQQFDILVTSALVKDFKPQEVAFVIGHELGHVLFAHNNIPAQSLLFDNPSSLPLDLARILLQWSRAAEISADRVGFLTCGNLSSAANAFFKLASGLHLDDDNRVLRALHAQFEAIAKITGELGSGPTYASTHPLIPIRFKSLELISLDLLSLRNTGKAIRARDLSSINQQVQDVLRNTEPVNLQADPGPASPNPVADPEFPALLAACLLYTALSDGPLNDAELNAVRGLLQQTGAELDEVLADCRRNPGPCREQARAELARHSVNQDSLLQILHHCAYLNPQLNAQEIQALRDICAALHGNPALVDSLLALR